jgi:predicted RNA-binding protein YlxR (DUF448 family)
MPATLPRRVPQRTCIACRSTNGKRELVRVVRTPEGTVEVDPTGKRAGRGAYICPEAACWQLALKKGRLEPALKVKLSADDRLRLTEYATRLPAAVAAGAP